jgi:hypothetical protein
MKIIRSHCFAWQNDGVPVCLVYNHGAEEIGDSLLTTSTRWKHWMSCEGLNADSYRSFPSPCATITWLLKENLGYLIITWLLLLLHLNNHCVLLREAKVWFIEASIIFEGVRPAVVHSCTLYSSWGGRMHVSLYISSYLLHVCRAPFDVVYYVQWTSALIM